MSEDIDENLMFVAYLSLVMVGVNIIWGMFCYPWGLIGFAFAAVDIPLFFMAKKARDLYVSGDYEKSSKVEKLAMYFGFVFGLVVVGVFAYKMYARLEKIITQRYLVKVSHKEYYAPPQFPSKKN